MPDARAPLEYDQLTPYSKFAVLYVGAIAALWKARQSASANVACPISTYTDLLTASRLLSKYFKISGTQSRPTQIRSKAEQTQRQLTNFLIDVHDQFVNSAPVRFLPDAFVEFRKKLTADTPLSEQLRSLVIDTGSGSDPVRFNRSRNDDAFFESDVSRPLIQMIEQSIDRKISHPELPGIPIVFEKSLATEYFGVVDASGNPAWKKTGLFAIVREARGPYTSDEEDINLVVRDLLWFRRRIGTDVNERIEHDHYGRGAPFGYYFSALDREVYEIRNVTSRNGMTMIDAVAFMKNGMERSLCMYYPDTTNDHPLHCREGIVMGTTRAEKRPGAWKFLIIRPNWDDIDRLDARLSVYIDYMSGLVTKEYNNAIEKCFQFVSDLHLVGAIYSREWDRSESDPLVAQTRLAFRDCLWEKRASTRRNRILLGNVISQALENTIGECFVGVPRDQPEKLSTTIISRIRTVLTDHWQLVEPAQIISSGYLLDTKVIESVDPQLRTTLESFTRRERILDYAEYAKRYKPKAPSRKSGRKR